MFDRQPGGNPMTPPFFRLPVSPGEVLAGRYRVEAVLGMGGTGIIVAAQHLQLGERVAIKLLQPHALATPQVCARFEREARSAVKIKSEHVARVFDVGRLDDGAPYMVMEYLEGSDLAAWIRKHGPLPVDVAVEFVLQACEAIAEAHALGIIHRDLKPANLFCVRRADGLWSVKVLDFGISKVTLSEAPTADVQMTRTQAMLGSPLYMSPEQLSSPKTVDARADLWALGVILYELLTGTPPFVADSFPELVLQIVNGPAPPIRGARPDAPPGLGVVIARCLERDRERRYGTVAELAQALEPFAPQRARASVERVSRVMRAATPSIDAPPPLRLRKAATRSTTTVLLAALGIGTVAAIGVGVLAFGAKRAPDAAASTGPMRSASAQAAIGSALAPTTPPSPRVCPPGMIAIPGGSFFMGSDDGMPREKPAHQVTLDPFCIDAYEVTVESYKACSDAGRCKRAGTSNDWTGMTDRDRNAFDPLCNARDPDARAKHPIDCVDWEMADKFCREQGGRLPTEAEWEFAARGPDGRKYPWGDEDPTGAYLNACGTECVAWGVDRGVDERAMYETDDGFPNTAPVGSFPKGASRYGVQDLVGNVWEWVADWYADYPDPAASEERDPQGPAKGAERVIRGGAWNGSFASWVRPTFRYKDAPIKRSYGIGFRCAR
jgi:serine/threonine-protein kinase